MDIITQQTLQNEYNRLIRLKDYKTIHSKLNKIHIHIKCLCKEMDEKHNTLTMLQCDNITDSLRTIDKIIKRNI